jgi:hypothetical protein
VIPRRVGQDRGVTDARSLRGPDFLPYDKPSQPEAPLLPPPPSQPGRSRWELALEGVPTLGIVALGAGVAALVLLVLVTAVADKPGPGATVVVIAAFTSLITGRLALKPELPKDSRSLIGLGQAVGVVAAVIAVLAYGMSDKDGGQPISVPSPLPSVLTSPQPIQPTQPPLAQPTPGPSLSAPPGAVNGFGVPSMPGPPQQQDPTALGTLYGHVVDTAHKPVPGATVTITRGTPGDTSDTPDCPTRITTQTDSDGVYRQQLCQLGDDLGYTVTITVPGASTKTTLFINSGQTTVYDVVLPVQGG